MDVVSYLLGKKSGGGGTTDYENLSNKPSINDVELTGNKSLSDLGIQSEIDSTHKLSADLVDDSTSTNKFVNPLAKQVYIIENNSSSNPFIFEENKPGIYYFKGTGSSYSVYFKALTSNTGTYNYSMSMNDYLIYMGNVSTTYEFAYICTIAINEASDNKIVNRVVKLEKTTANDYGFIGTNLNKGTITVVNATSTQTISGKKTFSTIPELSNNLTPSTDKQLVNKKYVDDKPTTYTGYDATKTQVLKNINGTLTWVDET